MPRPCTICNHPRRDEIDKACVSGDTNRAVSSRFGCSESAVKRHKHEHLPGLLAQARQLEDKAHAAALQTQAVEQQVQADTHALDVMNELRRAFQRINLLFDACDRWLRDPDNPEHYTLDPRAEDVTVVYAEVGADGKPVRKKDRLSFLLAKIAREGLTVQRWQTKHADPRELVLKTAGQLQSQTELLAKLLGELDERPTVNVLLAPEWQTVRSALVETLAPFPDARAAIADALVKLEAGSNGHRD